ncbi:MAG: hypothetical protein IKO00_13395 [Oscillospiraceae bacterium]|nr:hypothetical protein [Oscillospiraceae bacterium]
MSKYVPMEKNKKAFQKVIKAIREDYRKEKDIPTIEYPKAMMTSQQMEKDTATVNCGGEFCSSMFSKECSARVMNDKRFEKFLDECCAKATVEKKCYMGTYAYQIRLEFYPF